MISVRNSFKSKHEDLMCPRCKKEIDDEKHLLTKCQKLAGIQNKYNINDPNKVFNEGLSKKIMIKIFRFNDETEIEKKRKLNLQCLMLQNGQTCISNITTNATRFLKFFIKFCDTMK